MVLSDLLTGQKAVIVKVAGHGGFRKRLIEMGFIQGKTVRVVLNAPLKDPIEYEILGYKVSLRRDEASRIEVISEEEAREQIPRHEDFKTLYPDEREDEEYFEKAMLHIAAEKSREIRVALVGNPNCGKTSLFNIASGSHEHVGNYSGVTVDAKEGRFGFKGYRIVLVDLPGTYSLSAYSPEELYVRKNLIETPPDVVVNVVDASNLERNLYLTTQLIDMNLRVVMALNMYDELQAKGDRLDTVQLGRLLGMPVCPTVGRTGEGIPGLFDTVLRVYENHDESLARHIHINHGPELEKSIRSVQELLWKAQDVKARYSTRYLAIKILENDKDIARIVDALPDRDEVVAAKIAEERRIEKLMHENAESAIVDAKYAFVQGALAETYVPHEDQKPRKTVTDRIDAVVTNKWLAFPIFIALLFIVFETTFAVGQYPMDWIDWLVARLGQFVATFMRDGWLKDLVVDGIIAGVGSVLVFLPNILILYFFISLMEDSGYMARAAFIVDKLMHKIGLHGKSFIPMVMGFGCNVPAIMATRTIESRKARLVTIAVIPFMSCAGRLPVFVLLCGAFFAKGAGLALLGIYLLGIVLAILSALVFGKFVKDDDLPFVMELPPYRVPTAKAIGRHTWEKGRQYLQKMATTILIASIIIWCLGYFPRVKPAVPGAALAAAAIPGAAIPEAAVPGAGSAVGEVPEAALAGPGAAIPGAAVPGAAVGESQLEQSYLGRIGKAVEPLMAPMDFDWRMDVGLLTGVAAKELVVSSLGVMYLQDAPEEEAASATENDTALQSALARSVSFPSAIAYMIFVLLYFPCIATFVAIKNETGKWSWAAGICAYTMVVAWLVSFIGYRLALLIL